VIRVVAIAATLATIGCYHRAEVVPALGANATPDGVSWSAQSSAEYGPPIQATAGGNAPGWSAGPIVSVDGLAAGDEVGRRVLAAIGVRGRYYFVRRFESSAPLSRSAYLFETWAAGVSGGGGWASITELDAATVSAERTDAFADAHMFGRYSTYNGLLYAELAIGARLSPDSDGPYARIVFGFAWSTVR
jgi:hypothetical protein